MNIPILYINLDSRTDRRHDIEKLLIGTNYERVSAVYNTKGYIGCAMSHIKCLEIMIEREYNECIILEDDFIFKGSNNFNNLKLPNFNYDIFLLCNHIKKSDNIDNKYCRVHVATWTSGHIVNKSIAFDLLENLKEGLELYKKENIHKYFLDIYWQKLFNSYIAIGFNNSIATQKDGFSDIQGRTINRSTVN